MASGIVATAAEYMVKLGVQLDYANMDKMEKFLDSSAFKAASLGAALVAGVTAVYKFMKAMTSMEMEFVNLAREQEKSINAVRAQETALKAMGKTAAEVERDPALKKIKTNLEEIGKAMRLPDMTKPLQQVRGLQQEFYGLKMTLQYALQWLNHYLLLDLRSTIERLTAWFQKVRTWVQTRMQPFTRKLATFLGDFVRGVEGIFRIVDKIMETVNRLPSSVKAFGAAFASVYTFLKSGPLGKILVLLTAIGDLIKDFENYQFAKAKGVTNEMAKELFDPKNGYIGADAMLTEEGKNFLKGKGIDPSGIVGVALDEIWGPASEGDWGGAINAAFQPLVDGLKTFFVDDLPKLFSGEISLLDLVLGNANDTDEATVSQKLTPFGRAIAGGAMTAIGAYFTLNTVAPLVDSVFGSNAFSAIAVYFGTGFIRNLSKGFTNLTFGKDEAGKFSDPIVQSISELLESVFSIDLAQVMRDMGILNDDGMITEAAAGIADKIGSWSGVIGRVIASNMNPVTNWFTLAFDGAELVKQISAALKNPAPLTSEEESEIISSASGVLSSVTGLLGMPLLQALFAIGSDTTTRRDFLSLILGQFIGPSGEVKDAAYDVFGDKFAGGGLWDTFLDIFLGKPEGGYRHFNAETGEEISEDVLDTVREAGTKVVTKMDGERKGGLWPRLLDWLLGEEVTENGVTRRTGGALKALWDGIVQGATDTWNVLVELVARLWDAISPYLDFIGYKIKRWFADILEGTGIPKALGLDLSGLRRDKYVKRNGQYTTVQALEEAGVPSGEIAQLMKEGANDPFLLFANNGASFAGLSADGSISVNYPSGMKDEYDRFKNEVLAGYEYGSPEWWDALLSYDEFYADYMGVPTAGLRGLAYDAFGLSALGNAFTGKGLRWNSTVAYDDIEQAFADWVTRRSASIGEEKAHQENQQKTEETQANMRVYAGSGGRPGVLDADFWDDYIKQGNTKQTLGLSNGFTGKSKNGGSYYVNSSLVTEDEFVRTVIDSMLEKMKQDAENGVLPKELSFLESSNDARILKMLSDSGIYQTLGREDYYLTSFLPWAQANLKRAGISYADTEKAPEWWNGDLYSWLNFANGLVGTGYLREGRGFDPSLINPDLLNADRSELEASLLAGLAALNTATPVEAEIDPGQVQSELDKGDYVIHADVEASDGGATNNGDVVGGGLGRSNTTLQKQAWGGRIGSEGVYTVGEDGPEYIIPITKPRRAMDLIMNMLHEMGGSAVRRIVEGFGLNGGADTIGGSLSTLGIPNASISITNNVNVTNTIYVQGGDRSASEIGYAAYDASERYLLRTLQGVLT